MLSSEVTNDNDNVDIASLLTNPLTLTLSRREREDHITSTNAYITNLPIKNDRAEWQRSPE